MTHNVVPVSDRARGYQEAGARTCREDVELLPGDVVERGHVGLEVLGEDLLGYMGYPVGQLSKTANRQHLT